MRTTSTAGLAANYRSWHECAPKITLRGIGSKAAGPQRSYPRRSASVIRRLVEYGHEPIGVLLIEGHRRLDLEDVVVRTIRPRQDAMLFHEIGHQASLVARRLYPCLGRMAGVGGRTRLHELDPDEESCPTHVADPRVPRL